MKLTANETQLHISSKILKNLLLFFITDRGLCSPRHVSCRGNQPKHVWVLSCSSCSLVVAIFHSIHILYKRRGSMDNRNIVHHFWLLKREKKIMFKTVCWFLFLYVICLCLQLFYPPACCVCICCYIK